MLKRLGLMAGAVVLAGLMAQSAKASLVLDVRMADGTLAKTLTAADLNTPITMKVYAHLDYPGIDVLNDLNSLQIAVWGTKSTGTAVTGPLSAGPGWTKDSRNRDVAPPWISTDWNGTGCSPGVQSDLDGDGDLDLGVAGTYSGTNWQSARSKTGLPQDFPFTAPGPYELFLSNITFTPTALTGGDTLIQIVPRQEDNIWKEKNVQNNQMVPVGTEIAGTSVKLSVVPEPATLGLLALGGLLMLRRRSA